MFPEQPDPEATDPHDFRRYVLHWLAAFNDWHETVDERLAILDERTKDLKWVKFGTIATALIGLVGLIVHWHG